MTFKKAIAFLLSMVIIISTLPITGKALTLPCSVSIAAGKYHSLIVREDGLLYAWGDNTKGQIGNGSTAQQNTPAQIMEDIYQVAAGDYTSYALTYSGDLYVWGDNSQGECGIEGASAFSLPVKIMSNVIAIAATSTHAYAVSSNGTLYFWGESAFRGLYPFLGEVNYTYLQPNGSSLAYTPIKLMEDVKEVYCLDTCTSIIKTDGSLWCWSRYFDKSYKLVETHGGNNSKGETVKFSTWSLIPVRLADSARAIAPNGARGFYIDDNGTLCNWGAAAIISLPESLKNNIKDISTNSITTMFTSKNGELYAYGSDTYGLQGVGVDAYVSTPTVIANDVKKVCVGLYHAILVKQNGEVWTWGTNEYGQLGNGTGVNYNVPCKIEEGNGSENKGGLNNPICVVFDGKKMNFDVEPVIRNNRTLVPFRAIFEELGASVVWDDTTNSAIASKDGKTIKITVNENEAYLNDKPYKLDATPEIVSGRNMVPIRFISETMDCIVNYISSDRIIDIRSEKAFVFLTDEVKNTLSNYSAFIRAGKNGKSYLATGVVVDPAGIILTNKHVTEGMEWIQTTVGGITYSQYEKIYEDPSLDYSIYRVLGVSGQLSVPEIGNSDELNENSELISCGNPGGRRNQCYKGSVTEINIKTQIESTLYCEGGSSGSGVYNNAFELVALVYALDFSSRTLAIPMSLMREKLDDAIGKFGVAVQKSAA